MNTRNQIASNRQPNIRGSPGSFDKSSPFKDYPTDARDHRANNIKNKMSFKKYKKSKTQKKKSYMHMDEHQYPSKKVTKNNTSSALKCRRINESQVRHYKQDI